MLRVIYRRDYKRASHRRIASGSNASRRKNIVPSLNDAVQLSSVPVLSRRRLCMRFAIVCVFGPFSNTAKCFQTVCDLIYHMRVFLTAYNESASIRTSLFIAHSLLTTNGEHNLCRADLIYVDVITGATSVARTSSVILFRLYIFGVFSAKGCLFAWTCKRGTSTSRNNWPLVLWR